MAYPRFIGSSVNPEQLSLTIKSLMSGVIPIIILVARLNGFDLGAAAIDNIVDSILAAGSAIWAGISAVLFLAGLARKAYWFIIDLKNKR